MPRRKIVQGMDLGKLERFREALSTQSLTLGLEVTSTWEGHSGRSAVCIGPYRLGNERIDSPTRRYTLPYGAWKEVEDALGFVDPTDRPEPIEMALSAIAACLVDTIALNAPRHGIDLESLEIKISCDFDSSVLFEAKALESNISSMQRITAEVKVKGDLTDEQLGIIERLIRHSPLHGMLEYTHRMETSVTRA